MPIDPQDLTRITLLADVSADDRAWIAERCREVVLAAGDTLFHIGDPAQWMIFVLEGVLEAQRRVGSSGGGPIFTFRAGDTSGVVPYSRMVTYQGTGRAMVPTRVALFPRTEFDALLIRVPALGGKFAALLADRVRETTRRDQQFEKLTALGRLSAGLAHELNNPASAARRSAAEARRRASDAAHHAAEMAAALAESTADPDVCDAWCGSLERIRARAATRPREAGGDDPLARADREQAVGEWLEGMHVASAWALAATFADAGLEVADLEEVVLPLPETARAHAVAWCEAAVATDTLLATVENATGRIVELVIAVKAYTHMDRAMVPSPVDVREGLDTTLALFSHKLRDRKVTLSRELPHDVPPVRGYAGELNQVWTNLIDNAIDAAPEQGGQVAVRLRQDGDAVLVEVQDNGSGVPESVRDRIWEPFFTTKAVGRGTGLGLDIARHIVVEQHGGRIGLETTPGRTVFSVRLPVGEEPMVERHEPSVEMTGTAHPATDGAPVARPHPLGGPP